MITQYQLPSANTELIHSAYQPQYYTYTSDMVSTSSFYFLTKTRDNSGILSTSKIFPLSNSLCLYDPHRIIENKLSYDFQPTISDFTTTNNSLKEYLVEMSESVVSTYYSSSKFNRRYALNSTENFSDHDNYILAVGKDKEFLTRYSGSRSVRITDNLTMGLFNGNFQSSTTSVAHGIIVQMYTGANEWHKYKLMNTLYSGSATTATLTDLDSSTIQSQLRLDIPVGPQNINTGALTYAYTYITSSNRVLSGDIPGQPHTGSLITSETLFYDVYAIHTNESATSLLYRFNIYGKTQENYMCSDDTIYQLAFLNSCGAFEYINMYGRPDKKTQINRYQYKKSPYGWSGTSYVKNTKNFYNTTIENTYQKLYTLNTNWITEAQTILIQELLESPIVFLNDNNTWYAVQILNEDYVQKKYKDGLINYTIELMIADKKYNSQRG